MNGAYQHTQFGTVTVIALGAGVLGTLVAMAVTGWHPVLPVVGGVLLVFLLLFASLTVEVDDGWLRWSFGLGLISKRVSLEEIREVRTVRTSWIWGWGIRWTPRGWLYNVSGLDAVEVTLATGRRFLIGTDEPEELLRAITANSPALASP